MTAAQVLQLYPQPASTTELKGLYLSHNLRGLATDRPFVYSNYVTSIDGRIAVPRAEGPGMTVPMQIANDRDWRLFQELAIQADLVISSGRYLRDYVDGKNQEILRVYDDPNLADLKDWRVAHGLGEQPDLAVISASLDFPIPEAMTENGRRVLIFTTESAPSDRIADLERHAGKVIAVGRTSVDGRELVQAMDAEGYRLIYNATGPKVLHLLLAANQLDRLYLTFANRLLGGAPFSSIVEGALLDEGVDMTLNTLYYDGDGLDGLGQLFVSYNRA